MSQSTATAPAEAAEPTAGQQQKKQKRATCDRCCRPEKVCICSALPTTPIEFHRCQAIVLQHPHECRRKNRSMPLINLCVKGAANDKEALSWGRKPAKKKARTSSPTEEKPQAGCGLGDFHMRTIVHRRLGDEVDPTIMDIINDPNRDVVVLFPSDDAMTLEEGMKEIEKRRLKREEKAERTNTCGINGGGGGDEKMQQKIVVMFLDATWKYAQEMERANTKGEHWPRNIIRVKLSPPTHGQGNDKEKDGEQEGEKAETSENGPGDRSTSLNVPMDFKPERFNIRTPPTSGHLSTAECLAWVCAMIEDDPSIYDILMRPLDFMVEKWKSFSPDGRGRGTSNFLEGDGVFGGSHQEDEKKGNGRRNGRGGGKPKSKGKRYM